MAGSVTRNNGNNFRLIGEWRLDSQNVANNTSTVSFQLRWQAINSLNLVDAVNRTWTIEIEGATNATATTTATLSTNQNRVMIAWTARTFTHNADGTMSFRYRINQTGGTTESFGTASFPMGLGSWQTVNLPTIPRASTMNANPTWTAFSGRLTTNITRATSAFTHNLTLQVQNANATWTTVATVNNVGTSHNWNLTEAQLTTIMNALAGANTRPTRVQMQTMSGNTPIGGLVTRNGTVTAPSANTATLTLPNVAYNATTHAITLVISRVGAGTSQGGSLHSRVWLRVGTTQLLSRGGNNFIGFTGTGAQTITLNATELTTIRNAVANGQVASLNPQIQTRWSGTGNANIRGQVQGNNFNLTFNLGTIPAPTSVTSNSTLGNTTHIDGITRLTVHYPANTGVARHGWAVTHIRGRFNNSANGETTNQVTSGFLTAGSIDLATRSRVGVTPIGITVLDNRGNIRHSPTTNVTFHAYSNPTWVGHAERHSNLPNTVVVSGNGSRSRIVGTGVGALTNQLEVRFRHRVRGAGTWGGWITLIEAHTDIVSITTDANTITADDRNTFEVQFAHRDRVRTNWIESSPITVGPAMPTLFIGQGNGRVGVRAIPENDNSFELGSGVTFSAPSFLQQGRISTGSDFTPNTDAHREITFPIAFPPGGQVQVYTNGITGVGGRVLQWVGANNPTHTGFTITWRRTDTTSTGISWLAVRQ